MGNVCVLGLSERLPAWGESLRGQGFSLKPGGKGANQAVAAAYQSAAVSFISRLGDDAFAAIANELFTKANVDNAIVVDIGACREITTDHVDDAAKRIAQADIFVCQLELPLPVCENAIGIPRT